MKKILSCQDCLHYEVCISIDRDMIYTEQDVMELLYSGDVRDLCQYFTERSKNGGGKCI